jgi:hypothetical protein
MVQIAGPDCFRRGFGRPPGVMVSREAGVHGRHRGPTPPPLHTLARAEHSFMLRCLRAAAEAAMTVQENGAGARKLAGLRKA